MGECFRLGDVVRAEVVSHGSYSHWLLISSMRLIRDRILICFICACLFWYTLAWSSAALARRRPVILFIDGG
jgi:hypothetical protein